MQLASSLSPLHSPPATIETPIAVQSQDFLKWLVIVNHKEQPAVMEMFEKSRDYLKKSRVIELSKMQHCNDAN